VKPSLTVGLLPRRSFSIAIDTVRWSSPTVKEGFITHLTIDVCRRRNEGWPRSATPTKHLNVESLLTTAALHSLSKQYCPPGASRADRLRFEHRQNIAGGVFKPGDFRARTSSNTPLVCLEVRQVVVLKAHAKFDEFVYGCFNVLHGKIQDGK
jgi:hypothetical protein